MFKGCSNHQVFPGDTFDISADAEFTLYGLVKGKREHVFPIPTTVRRGFVAIPALVTQVEVKTAKSTNYIVVIKPKPDGREYLDTTPIEISVDQKRPPTLQEEMRRFISEEVSRVAEAHDHGSFEDEDDFSDEEENFVTSYTFNEMQEEASIDAYPGEPSSVEPPPDDSLADPQQNAPASPAIETDSPPATPAITVPAPLVKP